MNNSLPGLLFFYLILLINNVAWALIFNQMTKKSLLKPIICDLFKSHATKFLKSSAYQELTLNSKSSADFENSLLNMVCHDIATPLNVLQLNTQLIATDDIKLMSPEEYHQYTDRMIYSTQTIDEILQKVRNLQALRYGQQELDLKETNPLDVVQQSIKIFEEKAREKNIHFIIKNELASNCKIKVDKILLKNQVLANLISNAIKFSEKNSEITIHLCHLDHNCLIEVVDQGIGMSPQMIAEIFTGKKKTNRLGTCDEKGTGLGLPLAKTWVELMGGRLEVQSQEKSATNNSSQTQFRIILPASPSKVGQQNFNTQA